MNKKIYQQPQATIVYADARLLQEASTTTGNVYTDDPQDPGGALSNTNQSGWDDEDYSAPQRSDDIWDDGD